MAHGLKPTTCALIIGLVVGWAHAAAAQVQDIQVAFARWTGHTPIMVGIEKGIYAKYELNVKPVFYQSGVDMLQGQMAGQQDVSGFGTAPTLTAYTKGFDIVIIGMMSHYANSKNFEPTTVVAGPKAGIGPGEIQKLKGKKIATILGTAGEQHLMGLLKVAGLKPDEVTIINMGPDAQVTALKTGAIDVMNWTNPWATVALEQIPGAVPVVVGAGPCVACYDPGFLLTSRKILTQKKDLLEKFYFATAEAMQYTRLNVDEAASIASRWTEGVGLETLKKILEAEKPSFDPRFSKNIRDGFMGASIPFLLEGKKIDKAFDPAEILDATFYKKAAAQRPELFSDLPPIDPSARID